jgi:hypothetical protein
VTALQGCAGEGVEDPTAVAAPVINDRFPAAAMKAEVIGPVTVGASHSLGMEPGDQPVVTGVFVQEVTDGEIHGLGPLKRIPKSRSRMTCEENGEQSLCQQGTTKFPT